MLHRVTHWTGLTIEQGYPLERPIDYLPADYLLVAGILLMRCFRARR